MKKVLDTALEKKFAGIVGSSKDSKESASKLVATIVELQDGSGLKVCQNVTKSDPAYREVK